eukprot:gb/GEZN01013142.1/.p1 GENE.gb/GEZN01013142.1/~~gb/GEZN01013142.1/.p1  ORF type:complete len:182 (+),score=39.78 gb/GEZN01013142.1/:342-887(+)
MKEGESVLMALKRLGAQPEKKALKKKNVRTKTAPPTATTATTGKKEAESGASTEELANNKIGFEQVTYAANALLASGVFSIYQDVFAKIKWQVEMSERKELEEQKKKAALLEAAKGCKWEYRWNMTDQIRGIHTAQEMQAWQNAGYFKNPDVRVRIQREGQGPDDGWRTVQDVKTWEEGYN